MLLAVLALAVLALSPSALALDSFTDNENSGDATWLEPDISLSEIWLWKTRDSVNTDWWKFNASAGQHLEVRFRKYTNYNNPSPPMRGGTYYMKYEVLDLALRPLHQYTRTYRQGGGDEYRRDVWSYIVPTNLDGKHYVHIWVDPPNNDPYREYAYYYLNITVTDPPSLDVQRDHSGIAEMRSDYFIDFNHEDVYNINLNAGPTTTDLVNIHLSRGVADADVRMEVIEYQPWGGQREHILNRTISGDATDVDVKFAATSTSLYRVRIWRDFWDTGSTLYTIQVTVSSTSYEGDDVKVGALEVTKALDLRRETIEMGYDTHDWYAVKMLAGDNLFKVNVKISDPQVDDGHGYELVVYNQTGFVLWWKSSVSGGPSYGDEVTLPPAGTVTIFDTDEFLYIRFSADAGASARSVVGFWAQYDIEFTLSNRAPVLVEPFEDVYTWDEDTTINIELTSHFTDPDDDTMAYTVYNKTGQWTYDIIGLTYWGWLNITPPENWAGDIWWRLRAYDEGQTDPRHYIYIDLHLMVTEVPDRPFSNGSKSISCDEESIVSYDLNKLFYDLDMGQGGILHFGWNDTGMTQVDVTMDPDTGIMLFEPAVDVFGEFTFDVYCYDDVMDHVPGTLVLTVNPINDIPRISTAIPPVMMDEGDQPVEVDLSAYFHDVDGDSLVYTFKVPSEYNTKMEVYHKNNVATESRIIIDLVDDNFYGEVILNITCKDAKDTTVRQDLKITISNVPNPPFIEYTPVGNPSDIDEEGTQPFSVNEVLDPDELEYGLHTYTWYLDGNLVADHNESSLVYTPDFNSSGTHTARVVVTDPAGLEAQTQPTWTFMVRNVNRPPTASITTPPTALTEDEKLTLVVSVSDPDGDELSITWFLVGESNPLGSGTTLVAKLPPGTQTIEVEVEDLDGGVATDTYTIKVSAVEKGGMSSGLLIAIVVVIVVGVLVAVLMMMKKKSPAKPDVHMDLESLQQGYDPSQGRDGSAEDVYDPRPQDDEGYEELKR